MCGQEAEEAGRQHGANCVRDPAPGQPPCPGDRRAPQSRGRPTPAHSLARVQAWPQDTSLSPQSVQERLEDDKGHQRAHRGRRGQVPPPNAHLCCYGFG